MTRDHYIALFVALLMTIATPQNATAGDRLLTDFTPAGADFGWFVLNDNVMGGRSNGGFDVADGELRFSGRTNTNGGGFSSIRTQPLDLDLAAHAGIRLRVLGDGRRYTWRLTSDATWRGRQVSYWAEFDTVDGAWTTVDLPFTDFVPKFRGYRLEGPPLDPGRITGMGLMIYDGADGAFALRVADIFAWSAAAPFRLSQYRWQRRLLVVSGSTASDPELAQQLFELESTASEFVERDMMLVSLVDSHAIAGSRVLTAAEVAAVRRDLEIDDDGFALHLVGKDGRVKLQRDTATPMAEIYALIDTMPMRQQETAVGGSAF